MDQNIETYDVIIVGGGIAGLAAVNSLQNSFLKILLLERKPKIMDVNRGDTLYPHTLDILNKWGIRDRLLQKGAVKSNKIEIFQDPDITVPLDIISLDRHENNFLLSLNHELIEEAMSENITSPNVTTINGANVTKIIEENGNYSKLTYNLHGQEVSVNTKLIIAADGRDSLLRHQAEIQYDTYDFHFVIVILDSTPPANFSGQSMFVYGKDHEIIVGPLPNNRVRLSLIIPESETTTWMKMNDDEISAAIASQSVIFQDSKVMKSVSHIYEIRSSLAQNLAKNNLVLIGDSAHTVHPISGQGMALAVSDADLVAEKILSLVQNSTFTTENISSSLSQYSNDRIPYVKKLQDEIISLGNLLISENRVKDLTRIFMLHMIHEVPDFEHKIESILQAEEEKF